MASSTPASRGPVKRKGGGSTLHPAQHPWKPGPLGPPSPLPPAQPLALHAGLRKALYCVAEASAAFGTFTKETEKGDGSTMLREGGAWQKHAVPGAAGPAELGWGGGLPKQRAPRSSLTTILPAWPWGNPGSLHNKLIQITAREIYTRREPLPAAVLWAGAPALPCPRVPRPL